MSVVRSVPELRHILLIEDNPGHVRLVREAMHDHAQLSLHAVSDTVQAIHFLTRREEFADAPLPSLVILDLGLPIFSGKSLLEERRRHDLGAAPVVVLTSSAKQRADCMALGATEYHLKPDEWKGWQQLICHVVLKHLQVDLNR